MKPLIKNVKISKTDIVVGESVRIDVETADPAVEVTVNNVGGGFTHYLQFGDSGYSHRHNHSKLPEKNRASYTECEGSRRSGRAAYSPGHR